MGRHLYSGTLRAGGGGPACQALLYCPLAPPSGLAHGSFRPVRSRRPRLKGPPSGLLHPTPSSPPTPGPASGPPGPSEKGFRKGRGRGGEDPPVDDAGPSRDGVLGPFPYRLGRHRTRDTRRPRPPQESPCPLRGGRGLRSGSRHAEESPAVPRERDPGSRGAPAG